MGNVSTVVLNSITAVAATAAVVIGALALKNARDQKAAVKAANENAQVTADFVKANEKGLKLLAENGDVIVYQTLDGNKVEDIREEMEEARKQEAKEAQQKSDEDLVKILRGIIDNLEKKSNGQ